MRFWRPLHRLLFWSISISVILLALVLSLVQLALPWWASNPDRVARLLSARLGTSVEIEATQPYWRPGGPLIELRGVRLGSANRAESASIERAAWAIDFTALVRSDRSLSEFRVHGVDLTLARDERGVWSVLGLPELFKGSGGRPLTQVLHSLPAFAVRDSRLVIREADDRPERVFLLHELRWSEAPAGRPAATGSGGGWRGRIGPPDGVREGRPDPGHLLLALDLSGDEHGRLYITGSELDLAAWLGTVEPMAARPEAGRFGIQAWIDIDNGGVRDAQLEWRLGASRWRLPGERDDDAGAESGFELPELSAGVRWRRDGERSRLLVEDLRLGGEPIGRLTGQLDGDGLRLRAVGLRLDLLARLAHLGGRLPARARQWLQDAQPSGEVAALEVQFDGQWQFHQLAAHLGEVRVRAVDAMPGIEGLDLRLRADRDGAVVWPGSGALRLAHPTVLRQPIDFRIEAGAIAAWRADDGEGDGWQVAMDDVAVTGEGFRAWLAGGLLWRPGEPVWLDLGAHVRDSEVARAPLFWPIDRAASAARWYVGSNAAGRVVRGDAWLRGQAIPGLFWEHGGRLDAIAQVEDAGLRFHEDWPALSGVDAEVGFVNRGMTIQSRQARIAGIAIAEGRAEVADLREPVMRASGRARASGERLFALVEASPMQGWFGHHLEGAAVEGEPRVEVQLNLPLRRDLGEPEVDGRIRFAGERFIDPRWNLDFGDLQGELRFDQAGLTVEQMAVRVAGEAATVDLGAGAGSGDPALALSGRLQGWLSPEAVFGTLEPLAPVLRQARGRSDWQMHVRLPSADSEVPGQVRLESNLQGVALSLPAPLTKSADSILPLRVEVATGAASGPIHVRLGELLRMETRMPASGEDFVGTIALGGSEPEPMPGRGLVIAGQVPAFDLTGWLAFDTREREPGIDTAGWPQVILRAGELGVLGRRFRDVDLQVEPGPEGVEVRLSGPAIEGRIEWPVASAGQPVRARLERLYLPDGDEDQQEALGDALAPVSMPALDAEAADLRVGASRLGSTRLLARPDGDVYRIDTFATRSPAFNLDASGHWRRGADGDRSYLSVRLSADDLGVMLRSFGFSGLVEGGRTQATIEGHWAGSPAAFALERIDGVLELSVEAGRIVDVDPGVGRLFGLFNLREIPRRLMLDFRDFFSQGMRFNSIEGRFRLDVGDAWTEDLLLKAASADILVTGRTGLADRDYDQKIVVTPRVSGTLPVVGAIAGGPAGAAAGLVMQGLLRIDQATRAIYTVTGPWDEPAIVKQETEPEGGSRRRSARNPTESRS